jgi:hypothetical protein
MISGKRSLHSLNLKNIGKQFVPVDREKKKDVGEKEQGGNYDEKREHYLGESCADGILGEVIDDEKIHQNKNDEQESVDCENEIEHKN